MQIEIMKYSRRSRGQKYSPTDQYLMYFQGQRICDIAKIVTEVEFTSSQTGQETDWVCFAVPPACVNTVRTLEDQAPFSATLHRDVRNTSVDVTAQFDSRTKYIQVMTT